MVKRTKPRTKLGSHLKNPVQKADEALKIADLAFGTKQDSLNGMQKFGDLSLGKIETPGTKIYTPSYVFDFLHQVEPSSS